MATFSLQALIAEAAFAPAPCAVAHDWEHEGGRSCPKEFDDCSQAVYRCRTCGAWDYGTKGGPAHRECFALCHRDPSEA